MKFYFEHQIPPISIILSLMTKGGDLTQSYDKLKAPTPTEMSKGQSENTNNATKKFD